MEEECTLNQNSVNVKNTPKLSVLLGMQYVPIIPALQMLN
jgi:hypothetical protein